MKQSLIKLIPIFLLVLIIVSTINVCSGSYPAISGLFNGDRFGLQIILNLRLPPLILALTSGILLSLSGAIFQSILSNPLADPYILGISGGAASFIVFSNFLKFPQEFPYTFLIGFLGASLNAFLVYFLSAKNGKIKKTKLLLTGIILNGFYSAIILFFMALMDQMDLNRFIFWMMGDFSEKTLQESLFFLFISIIFIIPPFIFHRGFDLLSLGFDTSTTSGLDTNKFIIYSYLNGSLLSALSVSFVGIIGFVGLIIPNIIRIFFTSKHNFLLPFSAIGGAIFLILSDSITRYKLFQNVPVGAISAMIGVPFFIYLLRKNGNN